MKRWWKRGRLTVTALAVGLLLGLVFPVQAAQESGNLTLCLKNKEHSVEFALYRAAEIVNDQYRLVGPFAQTGVDLNHLEHASEVEECAAILYECISGGNMPADAGGITADGKLQLTLENGLYLVVQVVHEDDKLEVSPFLLSVPLWDQEKGEWAYQVTAYPKSEEVKPEPETETPAVPETVPEEPETTPETTPETVPETVPQIPPEPDRPDEPDEPDGPTIVPHRGVLGALRNNIGTVMDKLAGVLGARVRTGDESFGQAVFYILLAAAAIGCLAFVAARRRKENVKKKAK